MKYPTPAQQRTGVVSQVYIGQTGRTLKHHHTEHKRALRLDETAQSAVMEHAMEEAHTINWEDAELVDHNVRYHQRCTPQGWQIEKEQHKMNTDEGSLPTVYNALIHLSHLHAPY